jgi:hypothetical protein
MERANPVHAELAEHRLVPLAGLGPEGRGSRDDDDRRVRAAGKRDEPVEDDPVADLVLGAADDDD